MIEKLDDNDAWLVRRLNSILTLLKIMQLLAISVTQWFSSKFRHFMKWSCDTFIQRAAKSKFRKKNLGISGVNGFAAFLIEDRERRKQNSVMLPCIYLQSCIF